MRKKHAQAMPAVPVDRGNRCLTLHNSVAAATEHELIKRA